MLEDTIVSLLAKSPADQYSLFRKIDGASMSQLAKALSALEQNKLIRVAKYRRSDRTGLDIPIYSLSESTWASSNSGSKISAKKLDIHNLLAGVTSQRLVEYEFVARNLVSPKKQADILEIGSGDSRLGQAIAEFGRRKWHVIRIDVAGSSCDAWMDARMSGFRNGAFDQVICISTIEHIGTGNNGGDDHDNGDLNTVKEVLRILRKGGSAIISVPYGKIKKAEHRLYDRHALSRLVAVDNGFSVLKKEFYCFEPNGWRRCSQISADRVVSAGIQAHVHFHSAIWACLLLRKR
jgi:SAM-dependent methyltransferase